MASTTMGAIGSNGRLAIAGAVAPTTPVFTAEDKEDGTGVTVELTTADADTTNTFYAAPVSTMEFGDGEVVVKDVPEDIALAVGEYWGKIISEGPGGDSQSLEHFFVTTAAATPSEKHHFGGIFGRDLATLTERSSYVPKQFTNAGAEEFSEQTIEVTGITDTENVSLRRSGNQGRIEYADMLFSTLYELTKPYPKVEINGQNYEVMVCRPSLGQIEDAYDWFLERAD